MRKDHSMKALLLLILLSLTARIYGQEPSVSASEEQDQPQSLLLSLKGLDISQIKSAQIFTVEAGYSVDSSGQLIQVSRNVTAEFISAPPADKGMGWATLSLKKPLENRTYVVLLAVDSGKFASAKIDPKGTIAIGDKTIANRQVKISSPVYLGLQVGQAVVLERSRALAGSGAPVSKPVLHPGTVSSVDPDGVFVDLLKKLPAGQTSALSLKDGRIPAEGKIQLDSAPSNESDAYVLIKANAVAAVHQAPVFTLTGSIAPLHPAANARYWGPVQIDPSVVFDVGL